MSISRLIGDGRTRLSGCFTQGRFGADVRRTCVSCGGTGGGTTAGEPRAISYIPMKPFDPSASLVLVFNEQSVVLRRTFAIELAVMITLLSITLLTLEVLRTFAGTCPFTFIITFAVTLVLKLVVLAVTLLLLPEHLNDGGRYPCNITMWSCS